MSAYGITEANGKPGMTRGLGGQGADALLREQCAHALGVGGLEAGRWSRGRRGVLGHGVESIAAFERSNVHMADQRPGSP